MKKALDRAFAQYRWNGQVNILDIPALKAAVERMSDRQLSFYAGVFKKNAERDETYLEPRQIVLAEIERRCVLAYVEEGLGG